MAVNAFLGVFETIKARNRDRRKPKKAAPEKPEEKKGKPDITHNQYHRSYDIMISDALSLSPAPANKTKPPPPTVKEQTTLNLKSFDDVSDSDEEKSSPKGSHCPRLLRIATACLVTPLYHIAYINAIVEPLSHTVKLKMSEESF